MSKSRRFDGHRIDVRSAQLLPTNGAAQAYEALAMTRAAVTPPMPYPGYLPVADAAFATPFTRVTDAGRQMLPGLSKRYRIESRTASIENLEGSVRSRRREGTTDACDATSLKPD